LAEGWPCYRYANHLLPPFHSLLVSTI
jgi:hypothetical protein